MTDSQKHIISLVFYPGMTALDMVGPHQVFSALPGVDSGLDLWIGSDIHPKFIAVDEQTNDNIVQPD